MTAEALQWQRIREGDERAFEGLFRAWYAPLCAYARRILASADAAENLVQDLFCHLWERRQTLAVPDSVRAYLYRATLHRSLNALKAQTRLVAMEDTPLDPASATAGPSQHVEAAELERLYLQAVEQMPPARRQIFCLSRWEGKTYAEIADALELSVKTVENQMGKALGFLRLRLADYLPALWLLLPALAATLSLLTPLTTDFLPVL